jgi:hypothetical protein
MNGSPLNVFMKNVEADASFMAFESDGRPSWMQTSNKNDAITIELASKKTMDAVASFLSEGTLIKAETIKDTFERSEDTWMVTANLRAADALTLKGPDAIRDLVTSCGISGRNIKPAMFACANVIQKYTTDRGWNTLAANHRRTAHAGSQLRMESLSGVFAPQTVGRLELMATEDYGAEMNKVLPDIKTALYVAIMQFHVALTPRLVPVRTADAPVVQYVRDEIKVFNVADPESEDKSMVELFKRPAFVSNDLIRLDPLSSNDSSTAPVMLAGTDGYILLGKDANLLELSLDSNKYGHGSMNRTDIIADSVKVEDVLVEMTDGTITETFRIKVPITHRLVMQNNAKHSAMRSAILEWNIVINKNTVLMDGSPNTLFAGIAEAEGVNVRLELVPQISLRTGIMRSIGSVSIAPYHKNGAQFITTPLVNKVSSITKTDLIAYKPDARYSEENLRKSQISLRKESRQLQWPIPTGKVYVLDNSLHQDPESNGAAYLTQIIRLGQDWKTLRTIMETMEDVFDRSQAVDDAPLESTFSFAHEYMAGTLIRPRVWMGNLDLKDLKSIRDSDRQSDTQQRVITAINYLIEEQLAETILAAQLPSGSRPTYRVLTTNVVLNTIFSVKHIHDVHNAKSVQGSPEGIEFIRTLDSGVTLEIITTPFEAMNNRILMIPVIPGDPLSILNWGHNWDHGTIVGNYDHSTDTAAWNRMFASTREITFPTNPMGFVIDLLNLEIACPVE